MEDFSMIKKNFLFKRGKQTCIINSDSRNNIKSKVLIISILTNTIF